MKNINEMNLIEVENEIANIENDPKYFSASMADRLQGAEERWYEEQTDKLLALYGRRNALKRNTKEYWYGVLNTQAEYLTQWNEELLNNPNAYRKAQLNRDIEEAKATIEKAIAELNKIDN
jgi:hypothetical protein